MLRKFRFPRISPLLPAFNWYKLIGGGRKGIAWIGRFPLLSPFVPHPAHLRKQRYEFHI